MLPRNLADPTVLPVGTATFLFTDIEGSTRLVQELPPVAWTELLARHRQLLRAAFGAHGGVEVSTEGDSFLVVFRVAREAIAASLDGQRALAAEPWPEGSEVRVRMGLHSGEARLVGDNYEGLDVHRAARVMAAGHGGQVLLTDSTRLLAESTLPADAHLRDLGSHRLKDLLRELHLYQLDIDGLPTTFPPPRTLDVITNNLPTQLTSFIGREVELAEAERLFAETRLLTLTGPGGTGKSRLSLQLAAEASDTFPDGIVWVALAPIADATLVMSTIAEALGLKETGPGSALELVSRHLASRTVLLVLDNFEQVLDAGAEVAALLRAASRIKVLVTSRAPLRVSGEHEYPVPPLGIPDVAHLPAFDFVARSAGVRLFVDRAQAIRPDFLLTADNVAAVAAIAALVDGLPLAIELAASRVRVLAPQAILDRLRRSLSDLGAGARDLPARQQTLDGAIAWSHELLPVGVRRLLARFSVFRGGAALSRAEAVCGPAEDLFGTDVLAGLEMLVEHSLARIVDGAEEPRFTMLYVIREFALARLVEGGEAATVGRRHAEVFLDLAEEAAGHLTGPSSRPWLDLLELEHDNLRAALDWSLEADDTPGALRLVAAEWRFWQMRGHLREGRERVERVLVMPRGPDHPDELLGALRAAGGIAWWQGDIEACRRFYDQALRHAREHGQPVALAGALYDLGFAQLSSGDRRPDTALALFRESTELYDGAHDALGVARAMWGEVNVHNAAGAFEQAYDLATDVTARFRDLGQRFDLAWALHELAVAALHTDRLTEARAAVLEAVDIMLESGDTSGVPLLLGDFADLAFAEEDRERGMRLRGAAASSQDLTGAALESATGAYLNARYEIEDMAEERTALERAFEEGRAMSHEQAISYAVGAKDLGAA